jgi:hypothetical protein
MAQGLDEAKDEYATYYNTNLHQHFAPGDKVWLDGSDIATNQLLSKLLHQQLGSFTIEACVRHGAYRLALPPQL